MDIEVNGLFLGTKRENSDLLIGLPTGEDIYINKEDAKAIVKHLTEQFKLDDNKPFDPAALRA